MEELPKHHPVVQAFFGEHKKQEVRFNKLADGFSSVFARLTQTSRRPESVPAAARYLLPKPPFAFLENDEIYQWLGPSEPLDELKTIASKIVEHLSAFELQLLMTEDAVGSPRLLDTLPLTSASRILNIYYITCFESSIRQTLGEFGSLILWGGGYGSMARLLRLRNPHATIVVVDTPVLASLQWLYLSAVIGEDAVRLITEPQTRPDEGFISIATTDLVRALPLRGDVFIAPWTLGRDEAAAQSLLDREYCGAQHLFIGFVDDGSPMAIEIRRRAKAVYQIDGRAAKCLAIC